MNWRSLVSVLVLVVLCLFFSQTAEALITCQSIMQQSFSKGGSGTQLTGDVPSGATFNSVDYFYRALQRGQPWMKCPGRNCLLTDISTHSDVKDGAVAHRAHFAPTVAVADNYAWSAMIEVRIIVTYQTNDPVCSSQATFLVGAGADAELKLMIPKDKSINDWQGLMREIDFQALPTVGERIGFPTQPWVLCENNQLNHLCGGSARNQRFNFSQAYRYYDEGDAIPGMFFSCTNKWESGTTYNAFAPRWCRAVIHYAP